MVVLVAQLATSLVVYPIKSLVAAPRPSLLFSTNFPDVVLHKVDGVTAVSNEQFSVGAYSGGFADALFDAHFQ